MSEVGAYYVTDLYATSDDRSQNLDTLFSVRRLNVDEQSFSRIVAGVVAALRSMEDGMRRGHGSLKPQNVFLDATPMPRGVEEEERQKAEVPQVWLADPLATDVGGKTLRDDLVSLASLIYLMAFNQPLRRTGMVSLREESDWKERGYDGAFWRALCAELLGQTNITPTLDQAQRKVRAHEEKLGGGKAGKGERAKAAASAPAVAAPARSGNASPAGAPSAKAAATGGESMAQESTPAAWGDADAATDKGGGGGGGGSKKLLLIGGGVGALLLAGGVAAFLATRGPSGGTGGTGGSGGGETGGTKTSDSNGSGASTKPVAFTALTAEDATLTRLRPIFNVPGAPVRAKWTESGDTVLMECAKLAGTPLASTREQWDDAVEGKASALSDEAKGAVASDLVRLKDLAKRLVEWAVLKDADELVTKVSGMGALEVAAAETGARAAAFRRLVRAGELDFSASKAATDLGDGAVRLVKDVRASKGVLDLAAAFETLRAINDPTVNEIVGKAKEELASAGSGFAEIANRMDPAAWKAEADKAKTALGQSDGAFDRQEFKKALDEQRAGWGSRNAMEQLRSVNTLANADRFKPVGNDPRPKWKDEQAKVLDGLERDLNAMGAPGKVWPDGQPKLSELQTGLRELRQSVEQEGATSEKLFGHNVASVGGRLTRLKEDVDKFKVKVDSVRLASNQKIEEVLAELAGAGAGVDGPAGPGLKLIAEAAKGLSKDRAEDAALAGRLRDVMKKTVAGAGEIAAAISNAREALPGQRWGRDEWRLAAEKLGQTELTRATSEGIAVAKKGTEAGVSIASARDAIQAFARTLGEAMTADEALGAALSEPANVGAGGAVSAKLTQLSEDARAKSAKAAGAAAGVKATDFVAISKFDSVKALGEAALPASRDRLLSAMKTPGSAVEAMLALERLVASGAWPSGTPEFRQARATLEQMDAAVLAIPGQPAEPLGAMRQRKTALLQKSYLNLLAGATVQTIPEVVGALDETLTPVATMPAWAKYNVERSRVLSRLAGATDDQAKQIVTELAVLAKGAGVDGSTLGTLTSESGPTFSPAQAGPGKTGRWTLSSGDGASETLTYKSREGVELSFVAVGDGSSRVFVSATEVSLAMVNAAMDDQGFKALAVSLGSTVAEKTRPDEGVRGWVISKGSAIAPASPVFGGGDRSLGWLYFDERTNQGMQFYPAGVEPPPEPGLSMPVHHFSAKNAVRVAKALGGRLPTASEWAAAVAKEGGVTALAAQAKLRDEAWTAWMEHIKVLRASKAPSGASLTVFDPTRAVFGPKDTDLVVKSGKERLLFRPVSEGNGQRFKNLIGNVAEFVNNAPTLDKPEDITAASMANVQIVGGSALSAIPVDQLGVPQGVKPANPDRSFADVGFRVAFEAQGAEALATRAARVIESVGYAKPTPP
ncbi:MAG: hypothetical protein K2X32_01565 [Phycisphaerales bacterium]|nr:hypothetical protein [Phycisphaerales bacterium]